MVATKLSVVIPTKDRPHDLERCLTALLRQVQGSDEVIVINNGTNSETRSVLSRFPTVLLIEDLTPNLPHLFNLGWRLGTGDLVGFLNDDAVVWPDWIMDLKSAFSAHPDAAAIGGPTVDLRNRRLATLRSQRSLLLRLYDQLMMGGRLSDYGLITDWGGYSIGTEVPCSPTRVTSLTITNMGVRRNVLERLGGFDESLLFSNYDGLFFIRMDEAGLHLYSIPKAGVDHHVNPSGSTRSAYFLSRDYAVFYRKLSPKGFKSRIRRHMAGPCQLAFWLLQAFPSNPRLFSEALKGYLVGRNARLS